MTGEQLQRHAEVLRADGVTQEWALVEIAYQLAVMNQALDVIHNDLDRIDDRLIAAAITKG